MTRKHLAGAVRWFALAALTVFTMVNALTDHGVLMAINCFCLGFLFFSMLLGAWIDRRFAAMDKLMGEMKAAEAQANGTTEMMQKAIDEGRIEVFPLGGDRTEIKPPTRH